MTAKILKTINISITEDTIIGKIIALNSLRKKPHHVR